MEKISWPLDKLVDVAVGLAIGGAAVTSHVYTTFETKDEARSVKVEQDARRSEVVTRLDRIDLKLDRLIERHYEAKLSVKKAKDLAKAKAIQDSLAEAAYKPKTVIDWFTEKDNLAFVPAKRNK